MKSKEVVVGARYQSKYHGVVTALEKDHLAYGRKNVLCQLANGRTLPLQGHDLFGPAEEHDRTRALLTECEELLLDPKCHFKYVPTLESRNVELNLTPRALEQIVEALRPSGSFGSGDALAELLGVSREEAE